MAQPHFSRPEEALWQWVQETGVREIIDVALATKEASQYNVSLADFWVEMADLLGKDLEFLRDMRAQTNGYKIGAYLITGLLGGGLLLAYPFASAYMAQMTKTVFWFGAIYYGDCTVSDHRGK